MTDQELYNKVCDHLEAQGIQAKTGLGGICAYRGFNNSKCAAGCLILDEHYSPEMEGGVVSPNFEGYKNELVRKALIESGVDSSQLALVSMLQNAHDINFSLQRMNEKLIFVAEKFQLTPKQLTRWIY